jgi:hypothetical protein
MINFTRFHLNQTNQKHIKYLFRYLNLSLIWLINYKIRQNLFHLNYLYLMFLTFLKNQH